MRDADRTEDRLDGTKNRCREGFLDEVAFSLFIGIWSPQVHSCPQLTVADVGPHPGLQLCPLHPSCPLPSPHPTDSPSAPFLFLLISEPKRTGLSPTLLGCIFPICKEGRDDGFKGPCGLGYICIPRLGGEPEARSAPTAQSCRYLPAVSLSPRDVPPSSGRTVGWVHLNRKKQPLYFLKDPSPLSVPPLLWGPVVKIVIADPPQEGSDFPLP